MIAGGPRLPFSVTLLAFVLLFPGTIGPVISGFAEDSFGWRALFLVQAGIGAMLALAARRWLPRQDPDWSALRTDWVAVILLSLALATLMLVLSQGTRRFWFESEMIVWSMAACIGAVAGFAFLARFSPFRSSRRGCCSRELRHPHRAQPRVSLRPRRDLLSGAAISRGRARLPAAGWRS